MAQRVVVVDDEENIGLSLRLILERTGYKVTLCRSVAEFQGSSEAAAADVLLLDMRLPDGNGIELLRWAKGRSPAPVIMISGHATIADAVEATRLGAFDFLEKPLSRDKVLLAVKHALEHSALREENARLRELVTSRTAEETRMIGASPSFQRVVEQATMVARSDATVLLMGESGSGKELLAAHIHQASKLAKGPFVKVNCAAIPTELLESELFGHEKGSFTGATALRRGKFELADGGTIFLDEVGDLHENSQAKLLRVLQEGEFQRVGGEKTIRVNVRVVSATNRNLAELVSQKKFREDLYYRLCVVPVRVPALRERVEDIAALAEFFLSEFCTRNNFRMKRFDEAVFGALMRYNWPGNVRELRNVVERMAILTAGEMLTLESIPYEIRAAGGMAASRSTVHEARESAERDHIVRALEGCQWNVSTAARQLGMERTNLHKRMRVLGIRRP
jgi:two-component system, NtrC family, nitrogen regulation response regulator NtrX